MRSSDWQVSDEFISRIRRRYIVWAISVIVTVTVAVGLVVVLYFTGVR